MNLVKIINPGETYDCHKRMAEELGAIIARRRLYTIAAGPGKYTTENENGNWFYGDCPKRGEVCKKVNSNKNYALLERLSDKKVFVTSHRAYAKFKFLEEELFDV
jgi:hypothetical protein